AADVIELQSVDGLSMKIGTVHRSLTPLLIWLCAGGCDRAPTRARDNSELPVAYQLQLEPIAQAAPNRATLLAVDVRGNLYWTQESPDGRDVVFVAGGTSVPRATELSSAKILSALDAMSGPRKPATRVGATRPVDRGGTIQSLAPGIDGELYFYFVGGVGPYVRAALGRFDPRSGDVRILADTRQLAAVSNMSRSIELARGQLFASDHLIRLFLRHSDAWVIFEFDSRALPQDGPMRLSSASRLVRFEGDPLNLKREELELSAGPGTSLLAVDRELGVMYRIDDLSRATFLTSLTGLSSSMSPPLTDRRDRILVYCAEGRPIEPRDAANLAPVVKTQFPALALFRDGKWSAIGRDDLRAAGSFPVYAVRIRTLIEDIARDTYLGYDGASGLIIRMKLIEKK
ncbi:MAG: hypothetical protein ACREJC_09600, partial [Tepidisphaeraceae bacterium]